MKTTNIKNIKRINNHIPQFDLGTKPIDLGYQQSPNDVRVGTVDKLAESASPYILQLKQQLSANIKSGLTQLGVTGYGLYSSGLLSASTSGAAAAGGVIGANAAATGALGAQALANQPFTFVTASGAPAFTTTAANEGLGAASAGSSVTSYALPIAGMALGGYGIYSGLKSMDEDVATTSDIRGTAGLKTDYIGDYGYTTKSGIDSEGFMDATRRALRNSKIATTMSGIGTGASAGALAGSIIAPGIGSIIGTGVGAFIGGIGGLFGFGKKDDREKRMRDMLYAVSDTIKNENAQNKSVAMDKYVNSEFNNRGQADEGKVAGHGMIRYNKGKQAVVETSNGPKLGNINSMVGGGESIVNFNEGTARYIDHGTKRVDNIPSEVLEGDDNTIFGNLPFAGSTFANYAAPYSKYIEEINNTKPKTTDKNTLAVWERESNKAKQPAIDELKLLAKAQEMAHIRKNLNNHPQYKCGKSTSNYFLGKDMIIPTIMSVIPGIMGMNAAKQQENYYKNQSPTATSSYVANPNEAQAYKLLSQKLSPYNALREVDDVATQEMYGINSAPYSSGLKMAMLSLAFANRAKNASDVRYKYDMANMDLDNKLAASMLQTGESAAQRRQQANQVQQDMYDRAVARRLKGIETGRAGYLSNLMSMYSNILNNYWTNKNIGLYNQKLTNDKLALLASLGK